MYTFWNWNYGTSVRYHKLFGGGGKLPKIPAVEPMPEPERVVPVEKVTPKEEEDALRKTLAKRRRATLLARGIENQPNIYRQKLGAGG